ncbi:hypothetical protein [Flavobacterium sp. GCM10023249]|uniref:hypothetical protein n=1 Tax=unclassified Flavobacterium TaxID=196869 RepID=UPI00360EBA69
MKPNSRFQRAIATFFLLIFFPTLVPQSLYANNNGPAAPEATSFEPVDATDMVNLATGDMSYVLPLINVPSPEGGYPLALSYHAGIAMDQEASWVGLGWSLNPGAINRSVNGVPDDWSKSRVSKLAYDRGETLDYYNFGIGGTLPNGITIGISRSWGAHQAWGGTVGYMGMTMTADTDGYVGIGIGAGGASMYMDTEGNGGFTVFGLKYTETESGKSIGASYGGFSMDFDPETGKANKFSALGVSFDSKNNSVGVGPASINSSQMNLSKGDFYYKVSNDGFNLNAGLFWVSYQHTNVTYSLFKLNNEYVSGTLNLFDSKKENGYTQDGRHYMDVKRFIFDGSQSENMGSPTFIERALTLPNYDNYSISGQGIGGVFSPKIFDEILLYSSSGENEYRRSCFLTTPSSPSDSNYKLNNKIFFYFDNVNSSFLRTQKGTFKSLDSAIDLHAFYNGAPVDTNIYMPIGNEANLISKIITDNDTNFSSLYDNDGNLKKTNERKRDGNFIEAFTNTEIVNGNTNGYFLEVQGYDRNSYKNMSPDGIGAYRVTGLDGKVYHYSLPVYSMEEVQKNYKNANDENEKFFEAVKKNPYATHWLLTAITGPDYVDVNNNNAVDESDYGYWVQFDYGKWSDGYGWRSPKVGGKADIKYLGSAPIGYFYYWGRKEVYYLDKIKTRTHSALFLKSIRNDDKSSIIQKGNGSYSSGPIPRSITEKYADKLYKKNEIGSYYGVNGDNDVNGHWRSFNEQGDYRHESYRYVNLPENYSLKLDRILLLKNTDVNGVQKNLYQGMSKKTGYTYFDYGFKDGASQFAYSIWRKDPFDVRKSNINTDQNVLESADISRLNQSNGYDLAGKASKVINFNYDYSLGSNLPNGSAGRLALRSVELNGKNNIKILPPYKFNYLKSTTPYNANNYDVWGHVKDNPDAWSLGEIITPTGGKINIEYEADSFIEEAALRQPSMYTIGCDFARNNLYPQYTQFSISGDYITVKIGSAHNQEYTPNLDNIFEVGDETFFGFRFFQKTPYYYAKPLSEYNSYTVEEVDNVNKKVVFKINTKTDQSIHNRAFYGPQYTLSMMSGSSAIVIPDGGPNEVVKAFTIFKRRKPHLENFGLNGKKGGGIRVKKVIVSTNEIGEIITTEYDYRNPKNNRISGITSYEPFDASYESVKIFGIEEIPSPNVIYGYVSVSVKNRSEVLNKTIYKFKTLDGLYLRDYSVNLSSYLGDSYAIVHEDSNRIPPTSGQYGRQISYDKITLYDRLSNIGNLISVHSYNNKNQLLKSVVNNYKEFTNNEIDNGISQETFKTIIREDTDQLVSGQYSYVRVRPMYLFSSISKVKFPSRLVSSTTTLPGSTNTVYYDKYDFLTGEVAETRIMASDGKVFKKRFVPAYSKYSPMRSKVDNPNNRNMLSQKAAEYSYIYDPADASKPWKETGVGITTWNNEWTYQDIEGNLNTPTLDKEKVWRKHKTFVWNGVRDRGIFQHFDSATDDGFDWTVGVGSQSSKWKQISEVTKYDHYSMMLEAKDINKNHAATKMGDNDTKITTVGNAKYNELFYSGMENLKSGSQWLDPGIKSNGALRSNVLAHTGSYSASVTDATALTIYLKANQHKAGKYKLNVWVHKNNAQEARINYDGVTYNFNGETKQAGDWILKTHYLDLTVADIKVHLLSASSATVVYDDVMLRPLATSIAGYVYNQWDELSHIVGNNGLATRFEYDAAGRLVKTYMEVFDDPANMLTGGFKLTKENKMKYKYL